MTHDESTVYALLRLLSLWRRRRLQEEADRFVRRLTCLRADPMRQSRFIEWLKPMPDEMAVDALEYLLSGTQEDRSPYRAVMSTLVNPRSLSEGMGAFRIALWRRLASQRRAPQVAALLSLSPPGRHYYRPGHIDVNEHLETSLGWRKTLARRQDRMILDRLLHDKHPGVIRILLDNPRLVERDVVKMAALRPSSVPALETIFAHPRWIRRYSVKKALVFNPYSSPAIAMTLMAFLNADDLRDAARSLHLSKPVRERARSLLDARRTKTSSRPSTASKPEEKNLEIKAWKRKNTAAPRRFELKDEPSGQNTSEAEKTEAEKTEAEDTKTETDESSDEAARFLASLPKELPLIPLHEAREDTDEYAPRTRIPPEESPPDEKAKQNSSSLTLRQDRFEAEKSPPDEEAKQSRQHKTPAHSPSEEKDATDEEAARFLASLPKELPLIPLHEAREDTDEYAPNSEKKSVREDQAPQMSGAPLKKEPFEKETSDVEAIAKDFLDQLPSTLPLVPVTNEEESVESCVRPVRKQSPVPLSRALSPAASPSRSSMRPPAETTPPAADDEVDFEIETLCQAFLDELPKDLPLIPVKEEED